MRRPLWLLVCVAATASAAPKCPSVAEAKAAARQTKGLGEIIRGVPPELTPPLPVTWPPSGAPAARFFDFDSQPLPTGIVSYALMSPTVELVLPLDGSDVKRRPLGTRKKLGTFAPPVDPPKVELDGASAALLTALCENRMPTEQEAVKVREGYRAWLEAEPLISTWLAGKEGKLDRFVAWLNAPPIPPPAPPDAKLTARIDGDAVVLTRDGQDVRFERAGLKESQLTVVPLRADGSEPALWITTGQQGMLVRFANPPQVVYGLTYGGGRPGLFSTLTTVSLMDVDGDGYNDVVQYTRTRSDVGEQSEGPQVLRYDPLLGNYMHDAALTKKAPWVPVNHDTKAEKLIARALGVPRVELRGRIDPYSVPQPSAPAPLTLGATGSPPFVGVGAVYRVFTRKQDQKFGGHYHLAHVRYGKEPVLVSTIDLGEVGFPPNGCGGRTEDFRREGDTMLVVWPIDKSTLVEQRVKWDGKSLVKPEKAPVKIADCGL